MSTLIGTSQVPNARCRLRSDLLSVMSRSPSPEGQTGKERVYKTPLTTKSHEQMMNYCASLLFSVYIRISSSFAGIIIAAVPSSLTMPMCSPFSTLSRRESKFSSHSFKVKTSIYTSSGSA